eukprot:CAMPEP_0113320194 /NCGR_PEP_ID=MMETSP0010_2-20120614/14096_1 /TAXON_ID=216773 ORGANISM="Corethron hystrix, Strain 308" /NCGR_SAMPLE_ID=MMETSP0010_2 /ASSEMBLY_ACC=CAM_ASM_000155 /LENGTH=484 /DNA_ID=CAMNT_0000177919 /DNA_START=111 /DNA_END=1561 /DNA_ORIENTATION=- /assembly_acc=CAM_ASM_000155
MTTAASASVAKVTPEDAENGTSDGSGGDNQDGDNRQKPSMVKTTSAVIHMKSVFRAKKARRMFRLAGLHLSWPSTPHSNANRRDMESLPPTKFGELFRFGTFSETERCFSDLTRKAAHLLNAERAYIFLVDKHEHFLYTFLRESSSPSPPSPSSRPSSSSSGRRRPSSGGGTSTANEATSAKVIIPIDRGLTGAVLTTEPDGLNISHVGSTDQDWCHDLSDAETTDGATDDVKRSAEENNGSKNSGFVTHAYLGWPLRNALGVAIGVIEFRNKLPPPENGSKSSNRRGDRAHVFAGLCFNRTDEQMVQIYASQLANCIFHSRQNALIQNRDETFGKVYANKFDKNENIAIVTGKNTKPALAETYVNQKIRLRQGRLHSSILPPSLGNSQRSTRRWDFDVTTKSVEELTGHTIDIFEECGLFSTFSIPKKNFLNFMNDIVTGYVASNPYHNHLHAFDVMHVCYLMISNCQADNYLESFNILSLLV